MFNLFSFCGTCKHRQLIRHIPEKHELVSILNGHPQQTSDVRISQVQRHQVALLELRTILLRHTPAGDQTV
jgi:hypothetical protein